MKLLAGASNEARDASRPTHLLVTYTPFWRRDFGAAQRIAALHDHLAGLFELDVLYLDRLTAADRDCIASNPVPIRVWASPARHLFVRKARRRIQSTLRNVVPAAYRRKGPLRDGMWEDRPAVRRLCRHLRPVSVIVEYAHVMHAVEGAKGAAGRDALLVLDTHDAQSLRAERYAAYGLKHDLAMTRDEEARLLSKADVLVAIQPEEASYFGTLCPEAEVLVAGHACARRPFVFRTAGEVTLLFVGARGEHNRQAVAWFLANVWTPLRSVHGEGVSMILAGRICECFPESALPDGVHCEGFVADLGVVYERADIVVNPALAGSGLKIKNVEALSYNKPLVTTPLGAEGLSREGFEHNDEPPPYLACSGVQETLDALNRLITDAEYRRAVAERAHRHAGDMFSAESVFADLVDRLRRAEEVG